MEYFVQHRYIPLTGPLTVQGTKKKDRQIGVLLEFIDHEESRAEHLAFIKTAAARKKGPGRYGKNYEFLIFVEDRWFEPDDAKQIVAFVEQEVLTLPLEFRTIHLIGLTDRLFLSFEVPYRSRVVRVRGVYKYPVCADIGALSKPARLLKSCL